MCVCVLRVCVVCVCMLCVCVCCVCVYVCCVVCVCVCVCASVVLVWHFIFSFSIRNKFVLILVQLLYKEGIPFSYSCFNSLI